jgi:formate C-acetyltransferase
VVLTQQEPTIDPVEQVDPWRGFRGTRWRRDIDVPGFIEENRTPYEGDAEFLAGPTDRTRALWGSLQGRLAEERRRGIYDVDVSTPSSITSHAPGYIDREHEIVVGLQTDSPLKRAILPNGGLRMVEQGLAAYGYELDPRVREVFTKYRKTHNDGVFDAYTPAILAARRSGIITGLPDAYGRAGSSATTAGWCYTA